MTLIQIYYALKVAENGSMNKTAEALYISQPTLTNAIKDLEEEIGVTIFERTSKGVFLTREGANFLADAQELYSQYENLKLQYGGERQLKSKFAISCQHYTFAVKAFEMLVLRYDTLDYDFAFRETQTKEVVKDVAHHKSDLGILFMSDYNKRVLKRLLQDYNLVFHPLYKCQAYVYLAKDHPLASHKSISFEELAPYPCLSFEQGDIDSSYLAEEILSDHHYSRKIKVNDRATMLNFLHALQGYTLCSRIIYEELNGEDNVVIPFREDKDNPNQNMQIGYIMGKDHQLSSLGKEYLDIIEALFAQSQDA
jgi:DNA-binding transcriptional LysR family regulator